MNYSFWGLGTTVLPTPFLIPQASPHYGEGLARSDATAFICESGNLGHDPVFTLGMLLVPNVENFEEYLQQLRLSLHYFPRLSYSNNDYYQLPFAKAAINWLFQESKARFQVMAFTESIESEHPQFPQAPSRWQLLKYKQNYYDQLLEKAAIQNSMVYVKYQSPLGPSPNYGQHFFKQSNCYYQALDTRASNALQLSSLLTGCVAAAYENRRVGPVKQSLIEHLKAVLESNNLKPELRWKDRFVFHT